MILHFTLDLDPLVHALRELDQNLDDSVAEALQQAGHMVAAEARANHDYTDRTHKLTQSIHAEPVEGSFRARNLSVDVVADAPHARYVEEGTMPHEIRARRGKALRFYSRRHGKHIFRRSVQHPGTKPYAYLANALERLFPQVEREVLVGVERGFKRSGFEIA